MASWSLGSSSLDPSLIAGDIQCVVLLGTEAATKAGCCMGTSESPKQSLLVTIALFASLSRARHLATRAMGTRMNEKLLQARRSAHNFVLFFYSGALAARRAARRSPISIP